MTRATVSVDGETITVHIPLTFRKRGGRKLVVTPDGAEWAPRPRVDNAMVKALARAFRWRRMLDEGVHATLDDLARAKGMHATYVSRILRLTMLAPEIVEAILDGVGGYIGAVNGNFGCQGDSGSLVVGVATKKPIGLFFASNTPATCAAGAVCSAPVASVGNPCTQNSNCDNPAASGNGICQQTRGFMNPVDIVLQRFSTHF